MLGRLKDRKRWEWVYPWMERRNQTGSPSSFVLWGCGDCTFGHSLVDTVESGQSIHFEIEVNLRRYYKRIEIPKSLPV
jgi:hypothetical protein